MAYTKRKKTTSLILYAACLIIIILVMLIANRQSPVRQLQFPLNNGVSRIFTYANKLVAATQDDKMYIWNWSDLKNNPRVFAIDTDQSVLVEPNIILSVGRTKADKIIISTIDGKEDNKIIPLFDENLHTWLETNQSKTRAFVVLEQDSSAATNQIIYKIIEVDWQSLRYEQIAKITTDNTTRLRNVAVSKEGKYVLLTGQKGETAWLALIDATSKAVVWDKKTEDFERFGIAVFSPDDKFIYARTNDSTIYKIDPRSANIIDRWSATKDNASVLGHSSVQDIGVSPDGRVVASIVTACLYMWDSQTGRKIFSRVPDHKIESGLTFSPDGRFVATSDLRQGGVIKIWRVPSH